MTEMILHDGRIISLAKLFTAAEKMLLTISEITTDEFERGKDREARRELATALGRDPDAYSL